MRSIDMALDYMRRASRTLEEARDAFNAGGYPREHDVRDVLLEVANSRTLPEWFMAEVEFMASVSSDLARKRGPAFYGDEQALRPPSSIFTQTDASSALKDAERVHENCKRLIGLNTHV